MNPAKYAQAQGARKKRAPGWRGKEILAQRGRPETVPPPAKPKSPELRPKGGWTRASAIKEADRLRDELRRERADGPSRTELQNEIAYWKDRIVEFADEVAGMLESVATDIRDDAKAPRNPVFKQGALDKRKVRHVDGLTIIEEDDG